MDHASGGAVADTTASGGAVDVCAAHTHQIMVAIIGSTDERGRTSVTTGLGTIRLGSADTTRFGSAKTTGLGSAEIPGLRSAETTGLGATRLGTTGLKSTKTTRLGSTGLGSAETTRLGSAETTGHPSS